MRASSLALAFLSLTGCVGRPPPVQCGEGTVLVGGGCELAVSLAKCAPELILDGNVCVAPSPCAAGTVGLNGLCVPEATPLTCGAGTTRQGNACSAPRSFDCGPGTALVGSLCVPLEVRGDAGFYDVRLPVTYVPANGRSKIPVFSLGALPSGAPSTEPVVLAVDPPTAGNVVAERFDLATLGSTSYFTPNRVVGSFRISLASAAAPLVPLATTQDIALVPPTGVGSAAPCLRSDNVLFLDADPYYFTYTTQLLFFITEAAFVSQSIDGPSDVQIRVTPFVRHTVPTSYSWTARFAVAQYGAELTPGVYLDAVRAVIDGHPRLYVSSQAEICQTTFGAFEVHRVAWTGTTLDELLVSFEQHCPGVGSPGAAALHGCLHYRR